MAVTCHPDPAPMSVLDRYLIRATLTAFLGSLVGITAVVWVTQSLRSVDLLTTQGQTLWTYLFVTALAIPSLALVVAPVALFGAVVWVLNRLNGDSELAALSAAGVTPMKLMRPFIIVTVIVALGTGLLSLSAIPASLRTIRDIVTNIRADVLVNVLKPGAFTSFDQGITVHVKAREGEATLVGMLIEDTSAPEQDLVYTAERGQVARTEGGTYLVLENGALQRRAAGSDDVSIVTFQSYAFDLSPLADQGGVTSYRPRERRLRDLWSPAQEADESASQRGRIRAELHDRLTAPLYPLVFVLIAFAALGRTRSNRQGRFTAIAAAILSIVAVRIGGLGLNNLSQAQAWAVPATYALLLLAAFGSAVLIWGTPRMPRFAPRQGLRRATA
jgi:lipopolysaccharide export system permease protein